MKPEFNKTVDILVKAYLNDTLDAADCKRCAVGNIISQNNPEYDFYQYGESWFRALGLNESYRDLVDFDHPDIIKTGYTPEQLIRIESAFMNRDHSCRDIGIFNDLMAAVEVLAEIHQVDLSVKEAAKQLFVKA
jgi:hypothetical protein